MKSYSGLLTFRATRSTKRPVIGLRMRLRRRQKTGLEMRESQCLDTDLNLSRDLIGRRISISVKRSSKFPVTSGDC